MNSKTLIYDLFIRFNIFSISFIFTLLASNLAKEETSYYQLTYLFQSLKYDLGLYHLFSTTKRAANTSDLGGDTSRSASLETGLFYDTQQ